MEIANIYVIINEYLLQGNNINRSNETIQNYMLDLPVLNGI